VRYRLEGLLHLADRMLAIEWAVTERTQQVSLTGASTDAQTFPPEVVDVPVAWIADVRLRGGWWSPRLELRATRLDAFEGLPGGRPGALTLRVSRRDRSLAAAFAAALEKARATPWLASEQHLRRIRDGDDERE